MAGKFIAYFLTHSNAVLTDALESIINVLAGSFSLYGLYLSSLPKDENHPYGHGKIEFISATMEGSMISLAGIVIVVKSIYNFIHPETIHSVDIGIYITAGTALVNFILGSFSEKRGKQSNSLILVSGGKHLKSDTYSSIGLVGGLALIYFTGFVWIDGILAILFAGFIIFTGYKIVRESVAGIMDETDYKLIKKITTTLNNHRKNEWIDVHNLRVIKYGGTYHVDCHVTVPYYHTVKQAHDEIEEIDQLMKNNLGADTETFIHTDPCIESSCKICKISDCVVRKNDFINRPELTIENILPNQKHAID